MNRRDPREKIRGSLSDMSRMKMRIWSLIDMSTNENY